MRPHYVMSSLKDLRFCLSTSFDRGLGETVAPSPLVVCHFQGSTRLSGAIVRLRRVIELACERLPRGGDAEASAV